jgi:hypothetical protein
MSCGIHLCAYVPNLTHDIKRELCCIKRCVLSRALQSPMGPASKAQPDPRPINAPIESPTN